MGQKNKLRRWPYIACAIIAVIVAVAVVWREPLRMVFYSVVDPTNQLDVSDPWAGGEVYRNVQYADVSETDYLNLYVPHADAPAPLIVLVHGGGFVLNDCESRQAQLFYQYFRNHGWACATVNYRLAQEALFPAAVQDVKCAVRFLRANAEKYGYNADRIAIWGESAGGYLAVMASVTDEDEFNDLPFIGEAALAEPVSAHIDALVDYYGAVQLESHADRAAAFRELGVPAFIVDLAAGWLKDPIKDMPWARTCEDAWMGKPFDSMSDEEKRLVSPLYYAEVNLNPDSGLSALIMHGDADITVPWTQSKALHGIMAEKLGAQRVTFELIRNAKHADEDMYSDATLSDVAKWLETGT